MLLFLYRRLVELLGIQGFGIWSVLLAVASASRISEAGLAGSATRFVAKYRAVGDDATAREAVQTAGITVAVLMAVVLALLWYPLHQALSHILPAAAVAQGQGLLPMALSCLWLNATGAVWLSVLDGCLRTDIRASIGIGSTVLFVSFAIPAAERHGLRGLAFAQAAQAAIIMVSGWVAARWVMPGLPLVPTRWRWARLKEMASYGVNFQITSMVMILFEPTTKILMSRLGGLAAVGQFEIAERIVFSTRAVIIEANRTLVGAIAQLHERHAERVGDLYAANVKYLFVALTLCFSMLIAVAPSASEIWLGHYEPRFVASIVALALAWFINGLATPAYVSYLGVGRLKWTTTSHLTMGLVNVVLGWGFGLLWAGPGVIAAFCCAIVAGSLVLITAYHRETRTKLSDVLSRSDLVFTCGCFGMSALVLTGYSVLRLQGTRGARVGLSAALIAMSFAVGLWTHPLRRELVARFNARSQPVA
jgi:O-antigen/teichoic acid export membrane protein